jgi:hypothetical protein
MRNYSYRLKYGYNPWHRSKDSCVEVLLPVPQSDGYQTVTLTLPTDIANLHADAIGYLP